MRAALPRAMPAGLRAFLGVTMDEARAERAKARSAIAPAPQWCRLALSVSMVPAATGRIISIDRGPKTLRVSICAPRPVLWACAVAIAGTHPLAAQFLATARRLFGW